MPAYINISKKKKTQTDYWGKKKTLGTVATLSFKQTKSMVAFTHLPNKCHNIFTKHLFSIVVDHSFIFYYFILTYKKLTLQLLCNLLCSKIIYKREKKVQTKDRKKKKKNCNYCRVF